MLYDNFQMLEAVFNSYGVKTAEGTALDNLVKLNGLRRKPASHSTADLTLSGTPGTVIDAGRVTDGSGHLWSLDAPATIGPLGIVTASATCSEIGAIAAAPGTIVNIANPQRGWTAVTNEAPAVEGDPIETDAELKQRQTQSTASPSVNMIESMYAAISSLDNVKSCKVYENDTNITDDNGIPGHSVACVVEGGDSAEIAGTIYRRKGPGTGTYGTTEVPMASSTGDYTTIRFFRPRTVAVDVAITVTPSVGFTSKTEAAIRTNVAEYFDRITTGANVLMSSIIAVASRAVSDIYSPEFTVNIPVLLGAAGGTLYAADFDVDFNQRAALGVLTIGGLA